MEEFHRKSNRFPDKGNKAGCVRSAAVRNGSIVASREMEIKSRRKSCRARTCFRERDYVILEACVWITGPIRSLLERRSGIETVGGTGARRYRASKGARDRSDRNCSHKFCSACVFALAKIAAIFPLRRRGLSPAI